MLQHSGFSDDPARIEAEIARERAALAGTIESLRHSVSTEKLIDEAVQFAKAKFGPMTQAVDGMVRGNPIAAAVTAAGLAWLLFGRSQGSSVAGDILAGSKYEAMSRWEDEGGPVAPLPDADDAWISETDNLRSQAKAALAEIDTAATARLRPAVDLARERAAVIAALAKGATNAMARGLEELTVESRAKIMSARERAYNARTTIAQNGSALIDEHPFLAGALALAAGVAVARAIPMTVMERRLLGPERDRLFAEAHRLLQAERARLADVAPAV